ncbi:MAG: chorismate synthase, partial [Eubacterium sp.]|nr:chorismate synthase [Eubacterium sp.]
RPGHADFTYDARYGFRDYRGGGRSSGRETAGRVASGAVAAIALQAMGIGFTTYVSAIGPVECDPSRFDEEFILKNPLCMPDEEAYGKAAAYLEECRAAGDSSGGTVTCIVRGVPAGVGNPVFDKLDADLAKAMFSIGAVKGFEIGEGCNAARLKGSENNDPFTGNSTPESIATATNHCGGILGGISTGGDIVMRVHFKPTPSISMEQETVDRTGHPTKIKIAGRHDPIIAPRAAVVVETMAAATLLDAILSR